MSCEAVAKVLYSSRFSSGGLLQFRLGHLHRVLRVERLPPLLIASATFFPVGIVHGVSVWFGGW